MSGVGDTAANSISIAYDANRYTGQRSRDQHRHRKRPVHYRWDAV